MLTSKSTPVTVLFVLTIYTDESIHLKRKERKNNHKEELEWSFAIRIKSTVTKTYIQGNEQKVNDNENRIPQIRFLGREGNSDHLLPEGERMQDRIRN